MRSPIIASFCLVAFQPLLMADSRFPDSTATASPPLTTTAQIRRLSLAEAEMQYPVRLRGTVLYFDPVDGHAFLHDETGSIFFRPGRLGEGSAVSPAVGDVVEIRGVTAGGKFSPSVAGIGSPARTNKRDPEVRPVSLIRLGRATLPAPTRISAYRANTGEFHDQYIETLGTIRKVLPSESPVGTRILFQVSSPFDRPSLVLFLPTSETIPENWEDTPATFQCIASGGSTTRDDVGTVRLLLPSLKHIQPHFDKLEADFASAPRPLHQLFSYTPPETDENDPRRTHIEGTVTYAIPGKGFYIGDKDSPVPLGIYVQTPQEIALEPGDRIGAIGFPTRSNNLTYLGDAIVRHLENGAPLLAKTITVNQATSENSRAALISLEGSFIGQFSQGRLRMITFESTGSLISVRLETIDGAEIPNLRPGATIRVTGIFNPENSPTFQSSSPIHIIARTPDDIKILRQPPWLDTTRLRWIAISLVATLVLTSVWIALLRWRVSQQTRTLAFQTARQSTAEERQRIARELHDTLEQQLAGVQFHLDAIEDWTTDSPAHIRDAVGSARAMLDHSRSESRQSILQLRSPALENLGLLGAIRSNADLLTPSGKPAIHITSTGLQGTWPRPVEFHILRIVHEVITNSVKHAACDDVSLSFDYTPEHLRIQIQDNGSGFDPSLTSADGSGFGLLGIRERILKIHATYEIHSSPGNGTETRITVPRPGNS